MTKMRSHIGSALLACAAVATACSGHLGEGGEEDLLADGGEIGVVSEALVEPGTELIGPADYRWRMLASEADVRLLEDQGYRLFRIEVDQTSPALLFSALFVKNVGSFRQLGSGWSTGLTQAQVEAIVSDPARRLIDIASHTTSLGTSYAAVWVGNTGAQQKRYRVVLNALQGGVTSACADVVTGDTAPPVIGRVTDIDVTPTARWNAIVVEAEPGTLMREPGNHSPWEEHIGIGSLQALQEMLLGPIYGGPLRVVAIEPWLNGEFIWVLEKTTAANQFKSWATAGMVNTDEAGSADTIMHFERRMNARPVELKSYTDGQGDRRYVGIFAQTGPAASRGAAPQSTLPAAFVSSVDAAMQGALERFRLPGGAVAATAGGRLIFARGYGHQEIDAGTLADPDDRFRIASVSKTITAIAIMRMIEGQHLEPNCTLPPAQCPRVTLATRPFESVFNPPAPAASPLRNITLAHLLEHTSGAKESVRGMLHAQQWIAEPNPLAAPPGTAREYANGGYAILGEVIERVVPAIAGSGAPTTYRGYVQSHLFNPVGIERILPSGEQSLSFAEVISYENPDRTQRVRPENLPPPMPIRESPFPPPPSTDPATLPTGSWSASPIDMLRLIAGIDGQSGPQIFDTGFRPAADVFREMWSSTQPPPGLVPGVGNAFGFDSLRQPSATGFKGGYLPGSANAGLHLLANGVRIMWAFNGDGSPRSAADGAYVTGRGATAGDPLFWSHMKPLMEAAGNALGNAIQPATAASWGLGFSSNRMCPAYDPYSDVSSFCTSSCPCESTQGDCDSKAQCGGPLVCVDDVGGSLYGDPLRDTCQRACPRFSFATPNGEHCSATCPCSVGEGDCDADSECTGGLVCASNNGARFGKAADWDMCADPTCPTFNAGTPSATFCTRDCPCGVGEGGCTTNIDCAQELVCQTGIAEQVGLPSGYGVCQRPVRFGEPLLLLNGGFAGYLTATGDVPAVTGSGTSAADQFTLMRISGSNPDEVSVTGEVVALRHLASGKYVGESGSSAILVSTLTAAAQWRLLRDSCGCADGSRVAAGATNYWLEAIQGGDRLKASSTGVARVVSGAGGFADWRIRHAAP